LFIEALICGVLCRVFISLFPMTFFFCDIRKVPSCWLAGNAFEFHAPAVIRAGYTAKIIKDTLENLHRHILTWITKKFPVRERTKFKWHRIGSKSGLL
jgi:hypothetical protein